MDPPVTSKSCFGSGSHLPPTLLYLWNITGEGLSHSPGAWQKPVPQHKHHCETESMQAGAICSLKVRKRSYARAIRRFDKYGGAWCKRRRIGTGLRFPHITRCPSTVARRRPGTGIPTTSAAKTLRPPHLEYRRPGWWSVRRATALHQAEAHYSSPAQVPKITAKSQDTHHDIQADCLQRLTHIHCGKQWQSGSNTVRARRMSSTFTNTHGVPLLTF